MGIQRRGKGVFVDILGRDFAGDGLLSQHPRRAHDFRPPAVIDGDVELEPRVARRARLGRNQRIPLRGRQAVLIPQDADAHVFFIQLVNFAGKILQQQAHQRRDFRAAAPPVLRGKGINCQGFNADIAAFADDGAQCLRALTMPLGDGQLMRLGPAAVAIHDDSHMARQARGIRFAHACSSLSGSFGSPSQK